MQVLLFIVPTAGTGLLFWVSLTILEVIPITSTSSPVAIMTIYAETARSISLVDLRESNLNVSHHLKYVCYSILKRTNPARVSRGIQDRRRIFGSGCTQRLTLADQYFCAFATLRNLGFLGRDSQSELKSHSSKRDSSCRYSLSHHTNLWDLLAAHSCC